MHASERATVVENLVLALNGGRTTTFVTLLDSFRDNADVLLATGASYPLLHLASLTDDPQLIEAVLESWRDVGLSLDTPDRTGASALHHAAQHGHLKALDCLLNAGVGVDAEDQEGATPLIWAARANRERAVEDLLLAGADIDAQTLDGMSALMVAAAMNHESLIKGLLRAGADPLLAGETGLSARDLATKSPAEILALLEKAEAWRSAQQRRMLKAVVVHRNGQSGFVMPKDLARASRDYRTDVLTDVKHDVERLLRHTLTESPVGVTKPVRPATRGEEATPSTVTVRPSVLRPPGAR